MALIQLMKTEVVDGVTITRRVEERTKRIEISSPINPLGVAGYVVVAYREWVEYENDVAVKITALPPLQIPITPNMNPILTAVATRVDIVALQATDRKMWPIVDGRLQSPM